jgi:AmmeMemoRadiSam system protein A
MKYRVGGAVVLLLVGIALLTFVIRGRWSEQSSHLHERKPQDTSAEPEHMARRQITMTPYDKQFLLRLARQTIEEAVTTGRMPEISSAGLSSSLTEPKGCFVTLQKDGQLCGCIGHIFPQEPLYRAVMDNARSAALEDPRFPRVQPEELGAIEIEISVLTVPQVLPFNSPEDLLRKLRPHVDGVVLTIGQRQATFLPQVWEQVPDKETFLAHLAAKAGLPPAAWRSPTTEVQTYQADAFKESEM